MWAAAAAMGDPMADSLTALLSRKRQLQAESQRLQSEVRSAEKRRLRLVEKARGLSNEDLMAIVASLASAEAKAKAKAAANGKAKAKAKCKAKTKGRAGPPGAGDGA